MLVDLSVRLNEQMPVYPGDPKTKIEPAGVLERDGWRDYYLSMGTHAGTHIDAPAHMMDGDTLDKFPLERYIGSGRYVHIEADTFDLVRIKRAGISQDDIVLFHSGWAKRYHDPAYFEDYPAMSEEIAQYLVEQKVKMVGVDMCSVDNADGFPIHKILLGGGVLIIENLTNLEQLAGKAFKVYALPLNLDLEASPARVIAELEDSASFVVE